MCLFPKMNWFRKLFNMKPKVRVAERDIKVYKLLEHRGNSYYSYYISGYEWKLNQVQKESILVERRKRNKDWIVNIGLHSWVNPYGLGTVEKYLYNAIIPKGSHYIVGNCDNIVSDQLIIIGKYK